MYRKRVPWLLVLLCVWGMSSIALAQSGGFVPDKVKIKTKKGEGWFTNLDLGFTFSFAQSDGVVGIPDGTSLSFGAQVDGGIMYVSGPHEWRNSLKLVHTQTKTPTIEQFLKAADALSLESVYTYKFNSWIGLFVSFRLDTALVDGYLVKDVDTDLKKIEIDGTTNTEKLEAQQAFQLTAGLAPLLLKESLGAALTPYSQKNFRVDILVGGGSVQAFTQNGLVIEDDQRTAELELKRLQDYIQAGVELKVQVGGAIDFGELFASSIFYSLAFGAMLPLYSSITSVYRSDGTKEDLDLIGLLNFDLNLKVGVKLNKYMSLNYALTIVRAPLLQENLQITNNLILSFAVSIL